MDSKHFTILAVVCSLFLGQCIAEPEPGLLGLGGDGGEGGEGLLGNLPVVGDVLDNVPVVGSLLGGESGAGGLGGLLGGGGGGGLGGLLGGGGGQGVLGGVEGLLGHLPLLGRLLGRGGIVGQVLNQVEQIPDGLLGGGGIVGQVLNQVEQIPDEILQPLIKGLGHPILELGGKSILGVLLSGVVGDTVNAAGIPLEEAIQLIRDALSGDIPGIGKDIEYLIPHLLSITEELPNILGDIAKIPKGMKTAGNLMGAVKAMANQATQQGSGEQLNQLFAKLGIPSSELDQIESQIEGATDQGDVQYDEGDSYNSEDYEAQTYEGYPGYQVEEY